MSIPRWIRRRVPNVVPISQLFDRFPRLLNVWLPRTPWGIEGRIVFSLCPFPDESADVYQIRCQPVQPFDSFPRFCDPLLPPNAPWVLRGDLYLAYVHSQMNPQTWTKVGANRTASPYCFNCWPTTPPSAPVPPCVSRGNLFDIYPFPYECAHVCQIWCQSAQPFGSFSRICANVSSAFRRCTRWLTQKHAKKQHLYKKIIIPARTCIHQCH